MSLSSKYGFVVALGLSLSVFVHAQCPDRPSSGTVVADAPSIVSQNGTLSAQFTMAQSIDTHGYALLL